MGRRFAERVAGRQTRVMSEGRAREEASGAGTPVSVLFVCMGNICRSPLAEGVFSSRLASAGLTGRVRVDSAGTHAYHVGEEPDPRAQEAASRRGIDLSGQRARAVEGQDFHRFDYILAMDRHNFQVLNYACPAERRHVLHLLLDFAAQGGETEVPDPYYGEEDGFERALDLIESAAEGLIEHIRSRHLGEGI